MASAIYLLDLQLNSILERQYKHDLNSPLVIEYFQKAFNLSKNPVVSYNGIQFVYLRHDGIYLMTPVFEDLNVMCMMAFLSKLGNLLNLYMRGSITPDSVKDNHILVYELFDETLDFGIPQLTDFNILKEYIKAETEEGEVNSSISRTSTNKISWRPKGIFYNRNEIFINFNETLKFKYSYKTRRILSNHILGEVDCKCYLSGMPTLKMGLNEIFKKDGQDNNSIFTNLNFHQSVVLSDIHDYITFLPPDGLFKLLTYQISNTSGLKPLIMVRPKYRIFKKNGTYRLRIKIEIKTSFKRRYSLRNLKTHIPLVLPLENLRINFNQPLKFKTKMGSVIHNLEENSIVWSISKLEGNSEGEMQSEFELSHQDTIHQQHLFNTYHHKQDKNDLIYYDLSEELNILKEEQEFKKNNPSIITLEFDLASTLYSDLKINYLKIDEPQFKFQSFPWVRYNVACRDGDYSFVLSNDQFSIDLDENELNEIGLQPENTESDDVSKVDDNENESHIVQTMLKEGAESHESEGSRASLERANVFDYEEYLVEDIATGKESKSADEMNETDQYSAITQN
ncbi:hypothetical protein OGAPHI_000156 [Ogataea philodendri]|uniref:MHD domain-containing protein n=1 Tax=Ogataea philodendri TaxID=1378263 RepID=A0A9P8PHY4_9ASCO|nr:uncharacterized protein OGAPHI_000156 [Ogataea philodendri]KAH3671970.1 hypothetical protein OGAPHI_000156 [Ogataea philodendri]